MNYSVLDLNANCKHYISINPFYELLLTHLSGAMTTRTAKEMNVKLIGQFKPCKPCVIGKARKKNVTKNPVKCSSTIQEPLFVDVSLPTAKSLGGNKYWLLDIEYKTDYGRSFF